MIKLPARCYVLLHNGNIGTVTPGQTNVELNHQPEEFGGYQEVEITASNDSTKDAPKVLVRFTGADRLFRVDRVLARDGKYDACVGTKNPLDADADSGWQQGVPSGSYIHFTGDSLDGQRHGVVYTLVCVDAKGQLFR